MWQLQIRKGGRWVTVGWYGARGYATMVLRSHAYITWRTRVIYNRGRKGA